MRSGTKSHETSVSNGEIDNLAAMRLSQEPWRWRKAVLASKVTAGAKVAAFAILEFVNRKSGRCYASLQTIADTCDMTERGVRGAVAALREAGFVRIVRRGSKRTNLIYLAIPVIVMATSSDRHGHDKVTVTTMTPNLREEPLRENLTEKPFSELPVSLDCRIVSFDKEEKGREIANNTTDSPIRRANDDHAAYCWITQAAINLLKLQNTPKLADGRYTDRVIWEAIALDRRSSMVQRARKGVLMQSEVAEAIRGLDFGQTTKRAG